MVLVPTRVRAVQRRTLRTLVTSQVLGGVGVAVGLAVGALLAEDLSGSTTLAGFAITAAVLGGAVAAVPLARLSSARGRRPGLAAGYLLGASGAVVVLLAATWDSYPLLLAGLGAFGVGSAANLQARYAATDLAEPSHRSRALSTVVWATTVGAVAGPNLSGPAGRSAASLGLPELAGPFLYSGVAFLLAGLVVLALLRPDPLLVARADHAADTTPPALSLQAALALIVARPRALLGLAAIAVAHTVMVGVMTLTPVHMHHGGAELHVVGFVISMHLAGMYALSPLVGWAADRWGRVPVLLAGQAVLALALLLAGTASPGHSPALTVALFLLGLGWSAGLVAGSTLLTESVPVPSRPGVQGAADLVMGLTGAVGGAVGGIVVGSAGYGTLNAAAAVLVVALTVLTLHIRRYPATV